MTFPEIISLNTAQTFQLTREFLTFFWKNLDSNISYFEVSKL